MNNFGRKFRLSIFGESHGDLVGVTIDGCPAGINIDLNDFYDDLLRRKSGKKGTTLRIEKDLPEIVSGVYRGFSTGSPITILFRNDNTKPKDYDNLKYQPRPGHADFVANQKYNGFNDPRGGGHFSGRLTLALVSAGVIAKKILNSDNNKLKILAEIVELGGNKNLDDALDRAIADNDSIGGVVECRVENIKLGLGEPFFDSIESVICHLVFSIPAIKGIEFGSGFSAAKMTGKQHNDEIVDKSGKTETNNAGGINGGITNGNDLVFRVAVKPTSSISKAQNTYDFSKGSTTELKISGRHDLCIALRVPVVIEAVTAIALADFYLID